MSGDYRVGLVGESHYQTAIRACRTGDRVIICHEPDNTHDPQALSARTQDGRTIGYVPRSSWLRGAIFDEERGVATVIEAIGDGGAGALGVVLRVELTDDPVARTSRAAAAGALSRRSGLLDRWLGRHRLRGGEARA